MESREAGSEPKKAANTSVSITGIIGIIGSILTILLTVWNTYTKSVIDEHQKKLDELELELKNRAAGLDESRERVDRYKWVLSLFPNLEETDERKRNFTVSLMRLALTQKEAEQLFTGLQTSPDKTLQSVGQSGITAIQNEPIALMIGEMNASTAEVRKRTVARLINEYRSSSQAIDLALQLYDPDRINALSPSGLINGLTFLKATDPTAWKPQQVLKGLDLVNRIKARVSGPQTQDVASQFETFLKAVNR